MKYDLYKQVQAELGGISDSFKTDVEKLLKESDGDEQTKKLICEYSNITEQAIKSVCLAISHLGTSLVD